VPDLFSKFDPLIGQREALLESGLTDPFNLVMEKVESPTVAIAGRSCWAPIITWG
jgi:glycine C-acetyltransferase/8-amino-7-oxononanoate synthase